MGLFPSFNMGEGEVDSVAAHPSITSSARTASGQKGIDRVILIIRISPSQDCRVAAGQSCDAAGRGEGIDH